jgi:hypothetical protein
MNEESESIVEPQPNAADIFLDLGKEYLDNGIDPIQLLKEFKLVLTGKWGSEEISLSNGPMKLLMANLMLTNSRRPKKKKGLVLPKHLQS